MEKLTKDNFLLWSEKVKDHILALDCEDAEDIWEAFTWTPDPNQPLANQVDPALAYNKMPSAAGETVVNAGDFNRQLFFMHVGQVEVFPAAFQGKMLNAKPSRSTPQLTPTFARHSRPPSSTRPSDTPPTSPFSCVFSNETGTTTLPKTAIACGKTTMT